MFCVGAMRAVLARAVVLALAAVLAIHALCSCGAGLRAGNSMFYVLVRWPWPWLRALQQAISPTRGLIAGRTVIILMAASNLPDI